MEIGTIIMIIVGGLCGILIAYEINKLIKSKICNVK